MHSLVRKSGGEKRARRAVEASKTKVKCMPVKVVSQ